MVLGRDTLYLRTWTLRDSFLISISNESKVSAAKLLHVSCRCQEQLCTPSAYRYLPHARYRLDCKSGVGFTASWDCFRSYLKPHACTCICICI